MSATAAPNRFPDLGQHGCSPAILHRIVKEGGHHFVFVATTLTDPARHRKKMGDIGDGSAFPRLGAVFFHGEGQCFCEAGRRLEGCGRGFDRGVGLGGEHRIQGAERCRDGLVHGVPDGGVLGHEAPVRPLPG